MFVTFALEPSNFVTRNTYIKYTTEDKSYYICGGPYEYFLIEADKLNNSLGRESSFYMTQAIKICSYLNKHFIDKLLDYSDNLIITDYVQEAKKKSITV